VKVSIQVGTTDSKRNEFFILNLCFAVLLKQTYRELHI